MMCKRMLLNAKLARVIYADGSGGFLDVNPTDWLEGRV